MTNKKMTTAWANLPNAKHIDRILADMEKNPDAWTAAGAGAKLDITSDSSRKARTTARSAVTTAARTAAWVDAYNASWNVARDLAIKSASEGEAEREAESSAEFNRIADKTNVAQFAAQFSAWYAANRAASDATWDAASYFSSNAILALIAYDDCAYLLDENPDHIRVSAMLGHQQALLLYHACAALHKD